MTPKEVRIGYEVGTGEPVTIPIGHMVVTGQTQASGKTTTLEALIHRSGLKAVSFVTKRGEKSFTTARRIDPYFRERADWQFVTAVLESTLMERFKFERPWIMRVTKGARTLAEVHRNVTEGLHKTKSGKNHDIYMMLDEYLKIVLPQLAAIRFAPVPDIQPGINVIDVSELRTETQGLIISSVVEWVYEKALNTVVIIPEAWEFLPQQRSSPAILAVENLIRKGGTNRNFVWLDSQDIAAVHKNIIRSCHIWVLGVQREANEINRVLAHIPGGKREVKSEQIMNLDRGRFFVSHRGDKVRHVYVQPSWMDDATARGIAIGAVKTFPVDLAPPAPVEDLPEEFYGESLGEAFEAVDEPVPAINKESDMDDAQITKLGETIAGHLAPVIQNSMTRVRVRDMPATEFTPPVKHEQPVAPSGNLEEIYQYIKRRLIEDAPTLLKVVQNVPQITVETQLREITADGSSMLGRVARLVADGFFEQARTTGGVRTELKRTGPDTNNKALSKQLSELVQWGYLVRQGTAYIGVPAMQKHVKCVTK